MHKILWLMLSIRSVSAFHRGLSSANKGIFTRAFICQRGGERQTGAGYRHPCSRNDDEHHHGDSSRRHGTAAATMDGAYNFLKKARRFEKSFIEEDDVAAADAIKVTILKKDAFAEWLQRQSPSQRGWLKAIRKDKFRAGTLIISPKDPATAEEGEAKAGSMDVNGVNSHVGEIGYCLGEGGEKDEAYNPFALASLKEALPAGVFRLEGDFFADAAALAWALSGYKYSRYKKKPVVKRRLVWPSTETLDRNNVINTAISTYLVRDLISTPAEDCSPAHLQTVMEALATEFGGRINVIVGDDLLTQNYPQIHAVGRAAQTGREPRLMDLVWGDENDPKVTLVGKGVCFDTGGLNIKSSAGMGTMKKDMGGAAQVIGLSRMIMASGMKVRLRVLVPAVENSISGGSIRPGDILTARNGKTTEIGNTDAEGRLILADALSEATTESPSLLIDMATLTGAARVALGPEVPVMFCNDDELADKLIKISAKYHDHVWRLPLWKPYFKDVQGSIGDLKNSCPGAGAITAALYLQQFVKPVKKSVTSDSDSQNTSAQGGNDDDDDDEGEGEGESEASSEEVDDGKGEGGVAVGEADGSAGVGVDDVKKTPEVSMKEPKWIHLDFNAYNAGDKPGKPAGGEAQGMRAFFALLEDLYSV